MYGWITSMFGSSKQTGKNDKYGLQMSLTLSTHPLLEKYREDIRALNQKEPYNKKFFPRYLMYKCDIPKGRQDFPTIIVKGNQSCNKIYLNLPIRISEYLKEGRYKLIEALLDESYYGRSIYIKDPKYKEIDPFLFKPFQFDPDVTVATIGNRTLYWNVPMIFIGFDDVNEDGIYDSFVDILMSNPIGKDISSVEFLEYMSQPIVFWVKSEIDQKQNEKDGEHYDKLEYKMMSNVISSELFKLMRDSYLESVGRRLLNTDGNGRENYLEPKRLGSIR